MRGKEWGIIGEWTADISNVRDFYLLDAAIEWAEDQVVYRHGGAIDFDETTSSFLILRGSPKRLAPQDDGGDCSAS